MANALKQSALGYGTAALSGSKHPGKAAMYSGLASMPFSYLKANQAANAFNTANKPGNYTEDMFKTVVDTPGQISNTFLYGWSWWTRTKYGNRDVQSSS